MLFAVLPKNPDIKTNNGKSVCPTWEDLIPVIAFKSSKHKPDMELTKKNLRLLGGFSFVNSAP